METTRPRVACRGLLVGLLSGLDNLDEPDIEEIMFGFLDDLADAPAFDVALASFELITRLTAELGAIDGRSRQTILQEIAAQIADHPAP